MRTTNALGANGARFAHLHCAEPTAPCGQAQVKQIVCAANPEIRRAGDFQWFA